MQEALAKCAPVALFAYARLEHLRQTVDSLRANAQASQTDLYVFCDAPRSAAAEAATQDVRRFVESLSGFASITRIYRAENLGLARSIIAGVGHVLERHGQVIVVEDDLLLSPHFLAYMNSGLQLYAGDETVASVHGYCYPVDGSLPETFFLRGADCWGWGTWSRAWRHFESDGRVLLSALQAQSLTHAFDLDGAYPYTRMLRNQVRGRNDSWAVRWHASCFLKGLLTLYPGRSLVQNIGLDGSGTHCGTSTAYTTEHNVQPVAVQRIALVESSSAKRLIAKFFRKERALGPRIWMRVRSRLKVLVGQG